MDINTFGDRLQHYRKEANLTQEELAGRLGVTPQALSKWERNISLPDLTMATDLCHILRISADLLLGTEQASFTENHDAQLQDEILRILRDCGEPLELVFGMDFVPEFEALLKNGSEELGRLMNEQRRLLAAEGILLPLVRVRDEPTLASDEYAVLSYHCILHRGYLTAPMQEQPYTYLIKQLAKTVREHYDFILNHEIVKLLVDNLRIRFPASVEGIVPDKISYGLLQDILRELLRRHFSITGLLKIIETAETLLREHPGASPQELADKITLMGTE